MLCIHTLRDKKDIKAICQQKEREKRISLQGYVQHEYSGRIRKRALELRFMVQESEIDICQSWAVPEKNLTLLRFRLLLPAPQGT